MNPIVVNAVFGKEEYQAYCRFRTAKLSKASRNLYAFPLVLVVFAVLNFVLGNGAFAAVLCLLAAFIPLWMELNFRTFIKNECERLKLDAPRTVYELRFEGEEVTIVNDEQVRTYFISDLWRVSRTQEAIYLFLTQEHGFILPLSCFAEGDEARVMARLGEYLTVEQFVVQ